MKTISAGLFVAAMWLALIFGAQTASWSWGPALFLVGLALLAGAFSRSIGGRAPILWTSLLLASGWIVYRAATSEVVDFARADGLLVLALLGSALLVSGLDLAGRPLRILFVGLALAVIGNVAMGAVQLGSPEFTWPYATRPTDKPTGFFGHYNYFSNFILGAGFLLLGRALFSRDSKWQRSLYGLAFVGASVIVPLSGSRGGLLAMGTGITLMLIVAGVLAWRQKSRFLPLIALGIPLVLILSAIAGWRVLEEIQQDRDFKTDAVAIVENPSRLQWMDLGLKVVSDHPVVGAGSRGYSWERNGKWVFSESGYGQENEPFVHNELVQLAADYGWLGVGLVLCSLLVFVGIGFGGLFVGNADREEERVCDPVHAGMLSAAGAILIQANFSFVFHMLPSVLLLGMCFGLAAATRGRERVASGLPGRVIRPAAGLLLGLPLLWLGISASRCLERVWPVLYVRPSLANAAPELALGRMEEAEGFWPGFQMLETKGRIAIQSAARDDLPQEEVRNLLETSADAYRRASVSHPHHPGLALNLANTLAALGSEEEANASYERAIELQGGLEAGFRSRYYYASFLEPLWFLRWTKERRAGESLTQFKKALALLEEAEPQIPEVQRREMLPLQEKLRNSIGFLEGAGVKEE